MKILQVIAPGPMAGAEKSVLASTQGIHALGYDISLLAVRETRNPQCSEQFLAEARRCGLQTLSLHASGRIDPWLFLRMRSLLACMKYDVVHTHGYKSLTYLMPLKDHTRCLAATFHGATSHSTSSRLFEYIERALFERVDRLFVVSQGALSDLRSRGLRTNRVAVVPNMLTRSFLTSCRERKPSADSKLKLLFLGRLSTEKGLDVLLAALQMLPDLDYQLEVVGDGPLRTSISEQVDQAGLKNRIVFRGFQPDVIPYLLKADALIMPSRTEGLPMSLIEATTAGLPVIASRVGGIPEVITHNRNGLLVEPDRPDQLAKAIEKLHQNRLQYSHICIEQAQDMQNRFCSDQCCGQITAEYTKILTEKSAAGSSGRLEK